MGRFFLRSRPLASGLPVADLKTLAASIKCVLFNPWSAICNHQLKSPGGIPLRRDLRSPLTGGKGNLFSQLLLLAPIGIIGEKVCVLFLKLFNASTIQLLSSGAPAQVPDSCNKAFRE